MESVKAQGAARDALLQRILDVLKADPRIQGAWLSGSFGRGDDEADEWSDLDLHVAIEDDSLAAFLDQRLRFYESIAKPILIQSEFTQNPHLEGGVFQLVYFDGGIEVDWTFGPASMAKKVVGHRLLLEKRPFPVIDPPSLSPTQRLEKIQWRTTFFWAMAPIAIKYGARGATRQAASQTDLLTRALICLHRLLASKTVPDPWVTVLNRPLEAEIDAHLPRLGAEITPAAALDVISQLRDEMLRLHPGLIALGIDVHLAMVGEVDRLSGIAREVITEGHFQRRKYR